MPGLAILAAMSVLALSVGPTRTTAQDRAATPDAAPPDRQAVETEPPETEPPDDDASRSRSAPRPSDRRLTGWQAAFERLGRDMPVGRDVVVGHVEGGKGPYLPDAEQGSFRRVRFLARSGPSDKFGHATATARLAYGSGGLATGVRVVHCFQSDDWLTDGYLKLGQAQPPARDAPRLFNHSWIGRSAPYATNVLRRVDYAIDAYDVVMCVGVDNGSNSSVPELLASAYNVIAVGTAKNGGASSGGYTRIEEPGRCKPDIVGPRGLTSFTTPMVTGACAILLEAADTLDTPRLAQAPESEASGGGGAGGNGAESSSAGRGSGRLASRAEVVKAALLAGAVRGAGWRPEPGRPLDEFLGAGVLNIDRSLLVMQAGREAAGRLSRRAGWDFATIGVGETARYRFETLEPLGPTQAVLTWHRRIDGRTGTSPVDGRRLWLDMPRLANLDLRLIQLDEAGRRHVAAESASEIDNVELLHLPALEPGRYVLEVTRRDDGLDEAWDYALAWLIERPSDTEASSNNADATTAPGASDAAAPSDAAGRSPTPR